MKILCVIAIAFIAGCAATVCPPRHVENPTAVFVTDYGRHSSILLPASAGGFSEYAFGDWEWFVLNNRRATQSMKSLFASGRSGLGRKHITAPANVDAIALATDAENVFVVDVSSERVTSLREQLDGDFARHDETATFNARIQMDFVSSDEHYWLLHNCNHVTARWLVQLGCNVAGSAITSKFMIADQCR